MKKIPLLMIEPAEIDKTLVRFIVTQAKQKPNGEGFAVDKHDKGTTLFLVKITHLMQILMGKSLLVTGMTRAEADQQIDSLLGKNGKADE